MRFDMNEIFGARRETPNDAPIWLMVDDPMTTAIRDIAIDFLHIHEDDDMNTTETLVARLDAMLVLGDEIDYAGEDFWEICDGYSGELEAVARLADAEGVLMDELGLHRPVLFIRQLDLARDLLDAENFLEFFDLIPRAIFLLYNIHIDLLCYLIAERDGYYDEAAATALLDPRSVDGFSPLIYVDFGFKLDKTGEMLYRLLYN